MNKSDFYKQAVPCICGSLRIEDALMRSANFLRMHMPVDRLFLQHFDSDLNSSRTIAIASPSEGEAVDLLVHMSHKAQEELSNFAKEYIEKQRQQDGNFFWLFTNDIYEVAMIREFFGFHRTEITSLIVMPLDLQNEPIGSGSLFLVTEGKEQFNQKHAEMIALLKEPFAIAYSNARQHREVLKLKDLLADDNRYLHRELGHMVGDDIVGVDFGLREVMLQVRHVAPTESPVLLNGETGVGKDVIANAIHLSSPRRNGPFIPVNCGAIPDTLIDSELFGHEKGAFTGALTQKRGRFERADKGTILLDEIGEMPLEAQVRLLRVLQHREIERVGGTDRISVDIRIIAATNLDLPSLVRAGKFREDLYFRLNVFPIDVPPLRKRISDIPAFVQHFIERKTNELKVGVTPHLAEGAIDILMAYDWPGNVRELENVIERAMILHRDGRLRFDDLGGSLTEKSAAEPLATEAGPLELDHVTKRHIQHVLTLANGKIHGPGGAGELLGINPNTLRFKMKKLGIPFRKERKTKDG